MTPAEDERERKQAKARRKREKAKERERQLQEEIERETAEAGPSMGQVELESIQTQLTPLGLKIDEIPPDGNCLYRAIAASLGNDSTYQETSKLRGIVVSEIRMSWSRWTVQSFMMGSCDCNADT